MQYCHTSFVPHNSRHIGSNDILCFWDGSFFPDQFIFFLYSITLCSLNAYNTFIPSETLSPWWWGIHCLLSTLQRFAVCWCWLTTCYLACANVRQIPNRHSHIHKHSCVPAFVEDSTWLLQCKVTVIPIKCLLRYVVCRIPVLCLSIFLTVYPTGFFCLFCFFNAISISVKIIHL